MSVAPITNAAALSHAGALRTLRGLLAKSVSGELREEHLTHQIMPCRSHILWLVGHVAYPFDSFIKPMLGLEPSLPPDHGELFRAGVEPVAEASKYPSLTELIARFDAVIEEVATALESASDADLAKELPDSFPLKAIFPTPDAFLHGLVFHTGYHTGQITSLLRAQGQPSAFGM